MDIEFGPPAFRVLKMLREHAYKMPLMQAYDFAKEVQEMRHDLEKYEYIIMTFLGLLGINESGWLKDKTIGERLKDAPIEVWDVLQMATRFHSGYVCSPFTSPDWSKKAAEKFGSKREQIESYKESQLSVCFSER